MGDMADDFRALKEFNKERRRKRQGKVPNVLKRLTASGIPVDRYSEHHFRVFCGSRYYDFWPSTGRWRRNDGQEEGFNIEPLLKAHSKELERQKHERT